MSKYPTKITPAILAANAGVSTEELKKDIEDQAYEITRYQSAVASCRNLSVDGPMHERKLNGLRATAYSDRIREGQELLDYLKLLLAARVAAEKEEEPMPAVNINVDGDANIREIVGRDNIQVSSVTTVTGDGATTTTTTTLSAADQVKQHADNLIAQKMADREAEAAHESKEGDDGSFKVTINSGGKTTIHGDVGRDKVVTTTTTIVKD